MINFGVPKLLILCLLLLQQPELSRVTHIVAAQSWNHVRLWNREIPITPKYDCLDLFSGAGLVKDVCLRACAVLLHKEILVVSKESLCKLGYAVSSHDIEKHPSMDINSSAGFA